MRLRWYGTATVLLEHEGTQLLFDPFISRNSLAFKPRLSDLALIPYILVSHGHLDHISDIPRIYRRGNKKATVFCTAAPRQALINQGVKASSIRQITPGDTIPLGSLTIRVLKGRHVTFDIRMIFKTLLNPRVISYRRRIIPFLREHRLYDEAGETIAFHISSQTKSILILGSPDLDEQTIYPYGVDLLILPFQGRSDMATHSMRLVSRLKPKRILLTHHDDSFPPISSAVDTKPFVRLMRRRYPEIKVCVPLPGERWWTM